MRVAVVNWTNRRVGGAEAYVQTALDGLRARHHEIALWHEVDAPESREALDAGPDGIRICAADRGFDDALQRLADWKPSVLFVQRIDDLERGRQLLAMTPSVFFTHDYYGTCISGTKAFRSPIARPCDRTFGPVCLMNYFPRRCGGLSPLTMVTAYRQQPKRLALLRMSDSLVTLSAHMRREYLKHGFAASQVHHLPAVDTTPTVLARRRQVRTAAERAVSGVRLAFVGRLDYLKGCRVLLDILPALRTALGVPVTLTVAGDGPDMAGCRERADAIRGHDITVTFVGWTSASGCAAILADADALVVPSLWPEPFGNVGLEARKLGVPVAAFAVGGIPEWLDDGSSGALAPGDPPTAEGLRDAVLRCLQSNDIRARSAALAENLATVPSIDAHLDALIPVLEHAARR